LKQKDNLEASYADMADGLIRCPW